MRQLEFKITARVWRYEGKAGWYFCTIAEGVADEVKRNEMVGVRRGFGSVPVTVRLGNSEWRTSIFPEKKGTYLLPLKKAVREAEGVVAGDEVTLVLVIRD